MSKKLYKEWTMDVPWGKIALASWGHPSNPPVLMVHGFMDTAATFIPLMEQLPDTYYYVGVDFPGHGRSDPQPPGPQLTHVHLVDPMRRIVEHLGWDSFVCFTHSAGFLTVSFYNDVFPGKISKWVCMDPEASIPMSYHTEYNPEYVLWRYHNKYFENYNSFYTENPVVSTDMIVAMIAKNRRISKEQATVLLSRSLVPVGEGMSRLSFDPRLKTMPGMLLSAETQFRIIADHSPPLLILTASQRNYAGKAFEHHVTQMLDRIAKTVPDCTVISVNGDHDVHITNPERLAPHIVEFLNRHVINSFRAKL